MRASHTSSDAPPPRWMRALLATVMLAVAACTPAVPDGELTPRPQRTTNETRDVDLRVLDAWNERLLTVMTRSDPSRTGARARIAALAAADGWLAFARDEYLREPRSIIVDEVFAHARAAIEALERGEEFAVEPRLVAGTSPMHDELWSRYAQVRESNVDPALLGETAVLLVRAGRTLLPGETTVCDPAPFVARAQENLAIMLASTRPPTRALVVEATAKPARKPVAIRSVYFALDSDSIGPPGREMLDGVIDALADYGGVTIELQGFADPRGSSAYNMALSRRRATAVQQYIAARSLSVTTFEVKPVGRARDTADLADLTGLARDRRVDLRVLLTDGTELARQESLEADLQVEAARRARARRP